MTCSPSRYSFTMERWSGKVALVTGASAGIGASITEELAKNGLKVYAMARRVERVEELKKKLGKVKGEVIPVKGDVSKQDDVEAAINLIKQKSGTINVLVNNAGVVRAGLITESKTKDLLDVFNVNVAGLVVCTQKTMQLMRETKVTDGHIININSVLGHVVPAGGPPAPFNVYAASKHAVTALTETIRQELNHLKTNIKVTSVSPGMVDSEFRQASAVAIGKTPDPETLKRMESLPKLEPKDVTDAVLYTLSTPPHVQVHEIMIRPLGAPN